MIKFDIHVTFVLQFFSFDSISSEFNKRLGELIAMSMDQLRNSCSQSNRYKSSPPNLPKIVSLYLIQYHGYDRYV